MYVWYNLGNKSVRSGEVMKKKILFISGIIVLIGVFSFISILIYKNYNYKIDIQQTNQSWLNIDNNLESIKNNMDSITESNEYFDWWQLKDFDIEDDVYEKFLNNLVMLIRRCYLYYTDDGTYYTDTNPIRNFRDKKYITKKELEKLNYEMNNEVKFGTIADFENYSEKLLGMPQEVADKVFNKLNTLLLIMPTNLFQNENATYNELLLRKSMEIELIKEISDFLVEEYNSLK